MHTFLLVSLWILWCIFGSFASVIIWRIRTKEPGMLTGRSHCPKCLHPLGATDLFPVFSYLFLRGKCRFCRTPISSIYPILEITTGILFVLTWNFLINTDAVMTGNIPELAKLGFFLIIALLSIIYVFYDFLFMEIPDEVMIPANIVIFLLLFAVSLGLPFPFFDHYLPFAGWWFLNIPLINALLGGLVIFLFFYLQIIASKGRWMGGWDLRIAIFMGLVWGAKMAFLGLALAYVSGSIIGLLVLAKTRSRNTELPFGPYLALGLYLSLFFHTSIIDWYQKYLVIGA